MWSSCWQCWCTILIGSWEVGSKLKTWIWQKGLASQQEGSNICAWFRSSKDLCQLQLSNNIYCFELFNVLYYSSSFPFISQTYITLLPVLFDRISFPKVKSPNLIITDFMVSLLFCSLILEFLFLWTMNIYSLSVQFALMHRVHGYEL